MMYDKKDKRMESKKQMMMEGEMPSKMPTRGMMPKKTAREMARKHAVQK